MPVFKDWIVRELLYYCVSFLVNILNTLSLFLHLFQETNVYDRIRSRHFQLQVNPCCKRITGRFNRITAYSVTSTKSVYLLSWPVPQGAVNMIRWTGHPSNRQSTFFFPAFLYLSDFCGYSIPSNPSPTTVFRYSSVSYRLSASQLLFCTQGIWAFLPRSLQDDFPVLLNRLFALLVSTVSAPTAEILARFGVLRAVKMMLVSCGMWPFMCF